jgi:hypothetical protein
MKTNRIRILAMATLGFIAVGVWGLKTASASGAWKGSFTLPHELHWQNAVLPAGHYTFTMESVAFPSKIVIRGENKSAIVMVMGISDGATDQPSSLLIERRGGERYVRELYLAEVNLHFRYFVPAPDKELLAQGGAPTERVVVAQLGN